MAAGPDSTAELLAALSQLIRTVRSVGHKHDRQFGATGTPMGLLKALAHGDARVSDLACRLSVAPSVVSRAVTALEDEGLLQRSADPADARAWRIGLTEAGQQRLARVQDEYVRRLGDALIPWDDQEIASAAALLRRLEQVLVDDGDHLPGSSRITHPAVR